MEIKIKFIQNLVIILVCLIGFLIHLFIITQQYLMFEIETEIETNYAEYTVVIPDISLCNYMIDLIDPLKLTKTNFRELLIQKKLIEKDLDIQNIKDLLRNDEIFKIFEDHFDTYTIMKELIYLPDEIFISINFLKQNETFIGLDNTIKCKIYTYNQLRDICFSLDCPYDTIIRRTKFSIITDRSTLLKSVDKNTLLRLILNQTILKNIKSPFTVFVFSRGLQYTYRAIAQTSISILSDVSRQYDITYQRFRNIRLRSPYTTNCSYYTGYKSRNHKIESCIFKISKKYDILKNRAYFGNVIYSDIKNLYFDIYRQNLNSKERSEIIPILMKIFDECNHKNQQKECFSESFLPYLLKQRILQNDSNISILNLLATTLPEIKNRTKAKFSFTNLILFYGSICSFWFGLSVFRILLVIYESYYCSKIKINQFKNKDIKDIENQTENCVKTKNLLNNRLLAIKRNKIRAKFIGTLNTEYASSLNQLKAKLVYTPSLLTPTTPPVDLTPCSFTKTELNFKPANTQTRIDS